MKCSRAVETAGAAQGCAGRGGRGVQSPLSPKAAEGEPGREREDHHGGHRQPGRGQRGGDAEHAALRPAGAGHRQRGAGQRGRQRRAAQRWVLRGPPPLTPPARVRLAGRSCSRQCGLGTPKIFSKPVYDGSSSFCIDGGTAGKGASSRGETARRGAAHGGRARGGGPCAGACPRGTESGASFPSGALPRGRCRSQRLHAGPPPFLRPGWAATAGPRASGERV